MVASLNYKIFRNAAFLHVFTGKKKTEDEFFWQWAVRRFQEGYVDFPLHSETTTAGVIYLVLPSTFFFIFWRENLLVSGIGTALLTGIAITILGIYAARGRFVDRWQQIHGEYQELGST